ncbi:hypothetical protein B566_EDAN013426 [Ephemera danica]|nr:hypothetical protein B566_EDAN013426 [Ephemera danica]
MLIECVSLVAYMLYLQVYISRTMKTIAACVFLLVVVLATIYAAPNDCNLLDCFRVPSNPICGKRIKIDVDIPKRKALMTFRNECMFNFFNCREEIRYEKVFNGTCAAYMKSLRTTTKPKITTTVTA